MLLIVQIIPGVNQNGVHRLHSISNTPNSCSRLDGFLVLAHSDPIPNCYRCPTD